MSPAPEKERSVIELVLELIDLTAQYLRQQAREIVEGAVIEPAKRIGAWLAFTIVASTLFALAAVFLSVGLFQLLARLVGAAWIAYLIIGAVLTLCAITLIFIRQALMGNHGKTDSNS